jgi:hypothetical protein
MGCFLINLYNKIYKILTKETMALPVEKSLLSKRKEPAPETHVDLASLLQEEKVQKAAAESLAIGPEVDDGDLSSLSSTSFRFVPPDEKDARPVKHFRKLFSSEEPSFTVATPHSRPVWRPRVFITPCPKINGVPYMSRGAIREERVTHPFLIAALAIQKNPVLSFPWHGRTVSSQIDELTGRSRMLVGGAHCLLFYIADDEPELIHGVPNAEILVKTFLDRSILSNDDNTAIFPNAADHVLDQYERLTGQGRYADQGPIAIPAARIYNVPEARAGCGFFLVERIPGEFHPTWPFGVLPEDRTTLNQIREFFRLAAVNEIDVDLRPSNLRLRADGTFALIDLLESPPKRGASLFIELENRIKTFNCAAGDPVYNYLMEALASLPRPVPVSLAHDE